MFYSPWKWSEITFATHMRILRNLLKNAVFEAILTTCQKSSRFNGRFRTKECSKRKVSGELFGPKCDGEYISELFDTFGVDMEWSEMLSWASQLCKKCYIFMLVDSDFGPDRLGDERFRTSCLGFEKFMVKAINLQFTMPPYLPSFLIYNTLKLSAENPCFQHLKWVWVKFRTARKKLFEFF